MSGLPEGWEQSPLSELADFNPKHDPGRLGETVSFVPMPAVDAATGTIEGATDRPLAEVWRGFTHFADGDVIFAKITPCMENGKIAVARDLTNGLACGSTEFHVLRPSGALLPAYLWRFLRQDSFRQEAEGAMTGAVGQRRVPADYLKATLLPVPPLAEQRRIVAKLDALTARTARARADLDRIPALAARYKQAVLAKAFSGELTAEWRARNRAGEAPLRNLLELCESITDGDHQAPPRADVGIPFLTIGAMNDGRVDLTRATRFVPPSYLAALKPARVPRRGDVLYSVTGSFGIPALVETDDEFVFQRHIAIIKPLQAQVSGRFLSVMLRAPQALEQAAAVATGTAQLTVPLTGLRQFQVPAPTLQEQEEIIRIVHRAFAEIDRLTAEAAAARRLLDRLDQAILAKAFRGELVPQDPADEPAGVLLERIRAERAAAPKPKRGRSKAAA